MSNINGFLSPPKVTVGGRDKMPPKNGPTANDEGMFAIPALQKKIAGMKDGTESALDLDTAVDALVNLSVRGDGQGAEARESLRNLYASPNTPAETRTMLLNACNGMCREFFQAGLAQRGAPNAPNAPNAANGPHRNVRESLERQHCHLPPTVLHLASHAPDPPDGDNGGASRSSIRDELGRQLAESAGPRACIDSILEGVKSAGASGLSNDADRNALRLAEEARALEIACAPRHGERDLPPLAPVDDLTMTPPEEPGVPPPPELPSNVAALLSNGAAGVHAAAPASIDAPKKHAELLSAFTDVLRFVNESIRAHDAGGDLNVRRYASVQAGTHFANLGAKEQALALALFKLYQVCSSPQSSAIFSGDLAVSNAIDPRLYKAQDQFGGPAGLVQALARQPLLLREFAQHADGGKFDSLAKAGKEIVTAYQSRMDMSRLFMDVLRDVATRERNGAAGAKPSPAAQLADALGALIRLMEDPDGLFEQMNALGRAASASPQRVAAEMRAAVRA